MPRCPMLPEPNEAMLIMPGLALAAAINSAIFFGTNEGCAAINSDDDDTCVMAAKSLSVSYGISRFTDGLVTCEVRLWNMRV